MVAEDDLRAQHRATEPDAPIVSGRECPSRALLGPDVREEPVRKGPQQRRERHVRSRPSLPTLEVTLSCQDTRKARSAERAWLSFRREKVPGNSREARQKNQVQRRATDSRLALLIPWGSFVTRKARSSGGMPLQTSATFLSGAARRFCRENAGRAPLPWRCRAGLS